ncbi:MAG: energy transducer TonB [Bacteroidota bacterium]
MPDHHQKKHFLNLPKYPGGNKAFREFIAKNIRYPKSALEANVEGSVFVGYDIHDDGTVHNAHVFKGPGHGCDEEAVRIVNLLRFEKVKNRGIRVKMTSKTTIRFALPKTTISYTVLPEKKPGKPKAGPNQKNKSPVVFEYTVRM